MIKKVFRELSAIDHVLIRPNLYVGDVNSIKTMDWVVDSGKIVERDIEYTPALIKLFDEVITNSVDASKYNTKKTTIIKVNITPNLNEVSIEDNIGIPVEKHENGMLIPEMIFSKLMSGSNFEDDVDDGIEVGGQNGLGVKLVNILSKTFKVETSDGKNSYTQTFYDNMSKRTSPYIQKSTKKGTIVSWRHDTNKIKATFTDDNVAKMVCRVYDMAGINPHIKVYLNGKVIKLDSFKDYIGMYTDNFSYDTNGKWSVGIAKSNVGFKHVSFINGIPSTDGGTHIDYVMNQLLSSVRTYLKKKYKVDVRPSEIKNHIQLFLSCAIVKPRYNSQTKEKLVTEVRDYKTSYTMSNKLIDKVLASDTIHSIVEWIEAKKHAKELADAKKKQKANSKKKLATHIKANGVGRKILYLTEGECIEENTDIMIMQDDGQIGNKKIKNILIGDLVLTHNHRFKKVVSSSFSLKPSLKIKFGKGEDVISSNEHVWFVYDCIDNQYITIKSKDIDPSRHKMIRNRLAYSESFMTIEKIDNIGDGFHQLFCETLSIKARHNHEIVVIDTESLSLETLCISDIDISKHQLLI